MHRCDDLRQMSLEQLESLAVNSSKEEFGFRFGSQGDEKSKAGRRKLLRRQIARINTVIAEKKLGTAVAKSAVGLSQSRGSFVNVEYKSFFE